MKLHELKAVPGATKAPKRKGRGTATGQGTVSYTHLDVYKRQLPESVI